MSALQKDGPFAWFYLAITALTCFLLLGLADSTGIIVAVLIVHHNESNAKGGWIGSIVFFLIFGFAPVVVSVHNRFGFRWCMFISCFFYCLSFLITPFVENMNIIFLTFSIPIGLSISMISTLSVTTQREYFSKYYGSAICIRYGATALGTVVVSFVLPFVFDGVGYKNTFLCMLAFLPVIVCYGLVSRDQVTNIESHKNEKSTKKIYLELLQDKTFTLGLAGIALQMLSITIPHVFMVRYGMTLGYSLSKAKWFSISKGMTMFVATSLTGRMSDKALKHGKIKLISLTCCVIFGVCSLLCSFVESFPMIVVYMALVGLVEGVWWSTYPVVVVEITSGYPTNEAFGLVNFIVALVRLPGPPFLGWLFDITGDFRYALYIMTVISITAAIFLAISSHVNVEKHLSLSEKRNARKTYVIESDEARGVKDSLCFFHDKLIIPETITYETSV
ncbi:monocarboxylate transporter 12-like [Dendronephthya gigantea]|uniref:monocarboxylate transporter 12-like n=1 Tax=Dendronephthya gigantea TaxID=151771 RepID=UPI00106BC245|nr:monocarboxylate transporter 12-like [Dendronephthya gigantea]